MDRATAHELREIAHHIRHLYPPDHRNPHLFSENKDELAARIHALIKRAGAPVMSSVPTLPVDRPRRAIPTPASTTRQTIGGKVVIVQRVRAGFGV